MEWAQGDYAVTDDPSAMDADVIHGYLRESYWAKGIAREKVLRSMEHSLCFAVLHAGSPGRRQVGFCRVVSDRATFANLADVFILPEHQGRGLGKWLVSCVLAHPELQGLRRWLLATVSAHGLYARFGFTPPSRPDMYMERMAAAAPQPPE